MTGQCYIIQCDSGRQLLAIYLWSQRHTGVEISRQTGLDEHVVSNLRFWLRVCCTNDLQRNPVCIGGRAGRPVQLDKSMYDHKQCGCVGRRAHRKIRVFGMADTQFQPAKYHMQVVRNRSRRMLVPIINQRLVGRNHTIHTDLWGAYQWRPYSRDGIWVELGEIWIQEGKGMS